jgi:hypothetical protein
LMKIGVSATVRTARVYGKAVGRGALASSDLKPNVLVKTHAEAGSVSLVRDDAPRAADQAYAACRSGSA